MPPKAASLYPYPAVQYIPLLTEIVTEGPWSPPPGLNRPSLVIGTNDPAWREDVRRYYQLVLPPLTLASGEILLLALNLSLHDLKYRGNFVTVLAEQTPGRFQLIRLSQRLFYKDRIIFDVFSPDGLRLCWQPWDRVPGAYVRPPSTSS